MIGVGVAAVSTLLIRFMCVLGVLAAPGAAVSKHFGVSLELPWFGVTFLVNAIVYGVIGCAFGWAYSRQLPTYPRCCAICEYDLTGNLSGVCPECGTKIESP